MLRYAPDGLSIHRHRPPRASWAPGSYTKMLSAGARYNPHYMPILPVGSHASPPTPSCMAGLRRLPSVSFPSPRCCEHRPRCARYAVFVPVRRASYGAMDYRVMRGQHAGSGVYLRRRRVSSRLWCEMRGRYVFVFGSG
jgi:hypothetical protein